ncbi:MAG: Hsp20/alpha crystallin family protein [Thermoanaerobaculia bacterium]
MSFLTRTEKFDPFFEEFNTLRNRLDRAMNRFVPFNTEETEPYLTARWTPVADIYETKDNLLVNVEIPGMTEKDIDITLENNVLTIQGERRIEEEKEEKGYYRMERAYGKFLRAFTLPPNVLTDNVVATYNNGLLALTIPKKEEAKPKHIKLEIRKTLPTAAKVAA